MNNQQFDSNFNIYLLNSERFYQHIIFGFCLHTFCLSIFGNAHYLHLNVYYKNIIFIKEFNVDLFINNLVFKFQSKDVFMTSIKTANFAQLLYFSFYVNGFLKILISIKVKRKIDNCLII